MTLGAGINNENQVKLDIKGGITCDFLQQRLAIEPVDLLLAHGATNSGIVFNTTEFDPTSNVNTANQRVVALRDGNRVFVSGSLCRKNVAISVEQAAAWVTLFTLTTTTSSSATIRALKPASALCAYVGASVDTPSTTGLSISNTLYPLGGGMFSCAAGTVAAPNNGAQNAFADLILNVAGSVPCFFRITAMSANVFTVAVCANSILDLAAPGAVTHDLAFSFSYPAEPLSAIFNQETA